ncbi:MAG: Uma2 family endonuclease [bacterium]|nr:Uma2 family endonuclease [bacterium]
MVLEAQKRMTSAEFDEWVHLQDAHDDIFEFIGGEIFQMPSNGFSSMIATRIIIRIGIYLLQHDIGYLTTEAGGYKIGDERYVPDVAFVLYQKQKQPNKKGYNDVVPDLVVEVVSDSMNKREWNALVRKITGYLNAGVIVWIVDPEEKTIEIHQYGSEVRVLSITDTLTAPTLLPDFTLPLQDVFVITTND